MNSRDFETVELMNESDYHGEDVIRHSQSGHMFLNLRLFEDFTGPMHLVSVNQCYN